MSAKLTWYQEQFRLAQQKRFGASSEKTHRREGKWPFGHFANLGDARPARGSGSSCGSTVA
ncbi:transposase [Paenibacillus thiaminolyticus]|nr:transposase [Paenibacillus thiaminolyticus]WII36479.1 transposase [Paenibacillus thiaminolyticus]